MMSPCRAEASTSRAQRLTNRHVVVAASLLLLLPNALFAWHLKIAPAAIMLGGAFAFMFLMPWQLRPGARLLAQPVQWLRLIVCIALALALLVCGGEAHILYANWDWLWRDAVLADLARGPFPPAYDLAGTHDVLRAPLGMYMLPALITHATTLTGGHIALLTQNTVFLALILYTIGLIAEGRALLAVIVFLTFSGLDLLGEWLTWMERGHRLSSFVMPSHIEGWWPGLQYSSVVTQLFWVPNHALPGMWLALLALLCAAGEVSAGTLGLSVAASLFWSPFAFIGALPLVGFLVLRDPARCFGSGRFWISLAAALCFLPVAIYLQADAAQVPHAFLLAEPVFAVIILQFLLIEIPHAALVARLWSAVPVALRTLLPAALAVLVILPTVRLGSANDLVMRASIPSLTILAIAFAACLPIARQRHPMLFGFAILVITLGAVTPALEFTRAFRFPRYAISDCNLVTVWKKLSSHATLENYLASRADVPAWLITTDAGQALVDQPQTMCWPDFPYDPRSDFSTLSNAELSRAKHSGKPAPL